ncbi:MAG: substrate-binding domain-containing protein [Chloroflexi bacterium]|nr:substrate-binding domain-containing protein [Chloroflexota bacterium]
MIGFDNQEIIASALHPKLSTMQLPHYEMGRWAANYLAALAESDEPDETAIQQIMHCPYRTRVDQLSHSSWSRL